MEGAVGVCSEAGAGGEVLREGVTFDKVLEVWGGGVLGSGVGVELGVGQTCEADR